MEITLYQVNAERDYQDFEFQGYEYVQRYGIDEYVYDRVWSGFINGETLEDVFATLNFDIKPDYYMGRSMSVSDVCEVHQADGQSKFYFVDSVGFKEIKFDKELTREAKEREITVVRCQPGRTAEIVKIPNTLKSLQEQVGGYIEAAYPSSDPIALIVNEEGKLHGMRPNRALYTDDGTMFDIAVGPMLVVGLTEDDFGSLRGEILEKYFDKFKHPEKFMQFGNQLMALKIPEQQQKEDQTQKHYIHR